MDHEFLVGIIVKHSRLGLGRIISCVSDEATINFFLPPAQHKLDIDYIKRIQLPKGTPCKTDNCNCIIQEIIPNQDTIPYIYKVEYDNGLIGDLLETELTPIRFTKPSDPLVVLATLQQDGYPIFSARERLVQINNEMIRRGVGVKSILSSRIDLHPHQAYVAGTVILDSKQRYLLADEVGLGKTIEAGIVIHDLLARNSKAKILVLCPGALIQQWFSEMYSKFSGVIFRLPELSGMEDVISEKAHRVILSFHSALAYQKVLSGQLWDLVVIDEVHHLLRVRSLYELVKILSLQDNGLLLLSALPAQHREQEYYDLLALLEPNKYSQDDAAYRKRFSKLFERQREIGGRIGVVNRRMSEIQEYKSGTSRVVKQLMTLMELPVLQDDPILKDSIDKLDLNDQSFSENVRQIIYHISDYYRINRRILRNRREKLIEAEQIERVERSQNTLFYNPDQYELNALESMERLLQSMRKGELTDMILLPLTRQLFQAATHPSTLLQTLELGKHAKASNYLGEDYDGLHDLVSYEKWDDQMNYFWNYAWKTLDPEQFQEAIHFAEAWERQGEAENIRLNKLIKLLEGKHRTHPNDKFILFAGYPKLASILANQLSNRFGETVIARFYFGLHSELSQDRDLKEKEVRKFRDCKQTWLLVSDETGGEGRNFQFIAELINYDLPWQISKIEQRIGRLDRIGRKRPMVVSNLIIARGSKEEAWLNCLSQGLGIFSQSISGLEFALRDIELEVVRNLLSGDDQSLWDMAPNIKTRVEEERRRDESQNQMDEASYERTRADEFRRAQSNERQDRDLEDTFIQYFRKISDGQNVRYPKQFDYPEGVIEFHPEDGCQVQLDFLDNKKARRGTFRREIAQNRPDLEFFSVGNDFFDSVCRSLFKNSTGRTYAVECIADYPIWRGFEFSYRLKSRSQLSSQESGHQNLVDHLFAERIEHCFVNENGQVKEPNGDFLRLRRSFNHQNKNRDWKNLTKEKATFLSNYYSNWDELLRSTEKVARGHVRERYAHILAPKIERQLNNIDEQIRKLKTATPDGWEDQVQALCRLKEVLTTWELELDTVGFLSIKGGILGD